MKSKEKFKAGKIITAGIFVIILAALIFGYKYYVQQASERARPLLVNSHLRENAAELKGDDVIRQEVVIDQRTVDKLALWFDTSQARAGAAVDVRLISATTKQKIAEWPDYDFQNLKSDQTYEFVLPKPYQTAKEEKLVVEVQLASGVKVGEIKLKQSSQPVYQDGRMYINDTEQQEHDLVFYFFGGQAAFLRPLFLGVSGLVLAGAIGLYYLLKRKDLKPEMAFVYLGVLFGILYMVFWSPYGLPDEERHIPTAYYYSNRLMGVQPLSADGRVMVRAEDLKFNNQEEFTRLSTYTLMLDNLTKTSTNDRLVPYDKGPLDAEFVAYVPSILGITLARILNLSCVGLLMLARLFNLAFYLAIGYLVIRRLPKFKWFMLMFMLLPGILSAAASVSYDVVLNAAAFWFFAYVFEMLYAKRQMRGRDAVVLAVTMFILAPVKVVYVLLAAFCLLLPKPEPKRGWRRTWNFIPLAAGAAGILATRIYSVLSYADRSAGTTTGVEWSVAHVLAAPLKVLYMMFNTVIEYVSQWLKEVVWGFPEYSGIVFAESVAGLFLICLLLACFIDPPVKFSETKLRVCTAAVGISLLLALFVVFIFAPHTKLASTSINGIQGRYFLPFLPWLIVCLRFKPRPNLEKNKAVLLLTFFALHLNFVLQIIQTVILR